MIPTTGDEVIAAALRALLDTCDWCQDASDPYLTRHWCLGVLTVTDDPLPGDPDDVVECSCHGKHYR